jgi:hypothetical protein
MSVLSGNSSFARSSGLTRRKALLTPVLRLGLTYLARFAGLDLAVRAANAGADLAGSRPALAAPIGDVLRDSCALERSDGEG